MFMQDPVSPELSQVVCVDWRLLPQSVILKTCPPLHAQSVLKVLSTTIKNAEVYIANNSSNTDL